MSRRPPNAAAERAAQNQLALKSLVKLESNKSCADCKKNKHPRWASWNLGIFVCIRCSGIHRGMGTHISRVKSVDLDAWTDEQLQSMLRWGNSRANKYWEAKLAPGHIPAEAKIENFIRTKYDSKRWVMDGPMPDPATLDDIGNDALSSTLEQEPTSPTRSSSQRISSTSKPLPQPQSQGPVDLFGDEPAAIQRPSTTEPIPPRSLPPPSQGISSTRQIKPGESLLGMDFFGAPPSAPPARQTSATAPASTNAQNRPDLKQSILSLYASAPRPTAQSQQQTSQSGLSGIDDAFGSLNFSPQTHGPPSTQPAFANLSSPTAPNVVPTKQSNLGGGGGGGFFDSKPAPKPSQPPVSPPSKPSPRRASSGFGDFESAISPAVPAPPQISASNNSSNEPFGLSSPSLVTSISQQAAPPKPDPPKPTVELKSVFNLSAPAPTPTPQPKSVAPQPAVSYASGNAALMNMDPWGSSDVWGSSNNAAPSSPPLKSQAVTSISTNTSGWGGNGSSTKSSAAPKITEDEDFGGWSSNIPPPTPTAASNAPNPPKPTGTFSSGDDLFSNVWE